MLPKPGAPGLGLDALFHGELSAQDGAPLFVFGKGHPALDANPDSLFWWVVLSEQTLQ
jgi:hypothetical protein